jgi:hypothetical protein
LSRHKFFKIIFYLCTHTTWGNDEIYSFCPGKYKRKDGYIEIISCASRQRQGELHLKVSPFQKTNILLFDSLLLFMPEKDDQKMIHIKKKKKGSENIERV